jgi:hypothetical protein
MEKLFSVRASTLGKFRQSASESQFFSLKEEVFNLTFP